MRLKFALAGVAACIAVATVAVTSVPASAQLWWWPYYGNYNYGYYYPGYNSGYNYGYGYGYPGANQAWCEQHFRSYNPATGMYLGYDGAYHTCP
jgi:hypothetical protein